MITAAPTSASPATTATATDSTATAPAAPAPASTSTTTTTAKPVTNTLELIEKLPAPVVVFLSNALGPMFTPLLGLAIVSMQPRLLALLEPKDRALLDALRPLLRPLIKVLRPYLHPSLPTMPRRTLVKIVKPLLKPLPAIETFIAALPTRQPPHVSAPAPHVPAVPFTLLRPYAVLPSAAPTPALHAPGTGSTPAHPAPVPSAPTPAPILPAPPTAESVGNAHTHDAPVSGVLLWTAALAGLLWLGFVRLRGFVPQSVDRVLIAAPG
jgi:hypothetical protein